MPSIDRSFNIYGLTPIEVSVLHGGKTSRERALSAYIKTMEYAFAGVSNRVNGVIDEMSLSKDWCGSVTKKYDNVEWNLVDDMRDIIIYNVSTSEIQENMYLADSFEINKNGKLQPEWSKRLFETDVAISKKRFISAISAFSEFVPNYDLKWENGLKLYYKGSKISMESVVDDDVYTLLKLMTLIFKKGKHTGVFFINCIGFSDVVLKAMFDFLKSVYGDAFVFLYNCKYTHVEREVLNLPNLYIKEGAVRQ